MDPQQNQFLVPKSYHAKKLDLYDHYKSVKTPDHDLILGGSMVPEWIQNQDGSSGESISSTNSSYHAQK